jgi:hypothetical protein
MREMAELTWDDANNEANAGHLTCARVIGALVEVFDGEPSRLCPGVPRRAIWAACRLAFLGKHGTIPPGSDLALVAALALFEFQPDIEAGR